MDNYIIPLVIGTTLFYIIKKTSTSRHKFVIFIIYLSFFYDITIITGVIFKNNPILTISILMICIDIYYLFNINAYNNHPKISFKNKQALIFIIFSYLLIYVIEYFRASYNNSPLMDSFWSKIIFNILFIFTLLIYLKIDNVDSWEKIFHYLLRPYLFSSYFIIITSVLITILIVLGIVDAYQPLPSWIDNLTLYVSQLEGGNRYFPMRAMIIVKEPIVSGLFGITGFRVCGLSREPHIATLFISPAILLLPIYVKRISKKTLTLLMTILLFVLFASSLTNIFALSFCLLLFLLKYRNIIISRLNILVYLILIISLLFAIIITNHYFIQYITFRTNSISNFGSSGWAVIQRLLYLLSAKSMWGSGLFPYQADYVYFNIITDIGWIPMISLLFHIFVVLIYSIKLFFSNREESLLGLVIIYIIIHYFKHGLVAIPNSSFYLFFIVILFIVKCFENTNKKSRYIYV